jgi:hypothetical protein
MRELLKEALDAIKCARLSNLEYDYKAHQGYMLDIIGKIEQELAKSESEQALDKKDDFSSMELDYESPSLLECDIKPRPLFYPLSTYHKAISEGDLHYTWQDKPHRLVYDLIAAVRYYARPQKKWQRLSDSKIKEVIDGADFSSMVTADDVFYLVAREVEAELKELNS